MPSVPIVQLSAVTKEYLLGQSHVKVLQGVDFTIKQGDFIAITGASGSGKSTLLHILGCLDRVDSGTYLLGGEDVTSLSDSRLSVYRRNFIGFVFQDFNLLPHATVYENVALPFLYSPDTAAGEKILRAVDDVGLSHRLDHHPSALSGGERQRVAIARAIAGEPKLILADEPTGNLDHKTSLEIMSLFVNLHENGATILLVSHDREVSNIANTLYEMKNGMLRCPA